LGKIEFHRNNEVFEKVTTSLLQNVLNYNSKNITVEERLIHSLVERGRVSVVKIHNSTKITLSNGSYLRFCPYGNKGLEITTVYVKEVNQGKGDGTFLISFLYENITQSLGQFPEMMLECTGRVGFGETLINNDIQKQTKFFRHFGFRVTQEGINYPYYVKMVFDFTKLLDY